MDENSEAESNEINGFQRKKKIEVYRWCVLYPWYCYLSWDWLSLVNMLNFECLAGKKKTPTVKQNIFCSMQGPFFMSKVLIMVRKNNIF